MQEEKKYPIGYYAPGNYQCKCCDCGGGFQGDKRAVQCEPCAVANKQKFDALSPDEQKELMQRNAEAMREVFKNWGKKCICNEPYDSERHEGGYPRCPVHDKPLDVVIIGHGKPEQHPTGGNVWVKASERLPMKGPLEKTQWRDAETKKEISSTAAKSAINTNQKELVEWYDESNEQPVEQKQNEVEDIDELWDEHSELIDDEIDSLTRWAGSTVMDKEQFRKAVEKVMNNQNRNDENS